MTAPYWSDDMVTLHMGDALDVLREMPDASVDAIVTDPPAGIAFMGRDWDRDHGGRDQWIGYLAERLEQATRCLKPGGHALIWALPRTSHWTAMAIEDAGLEIRDSLHHIFGSGFPKSLDVSKAIDKAAGAARPVVAEGVPVKRMIPGADQNRTGSWINDNGREYVPAVTAPATEGAARWEGWGTALKPSHEVWWLARKPLAGTVAANVLEHGTGALNIDGCQVAAIDQKGSWAGYSKSTKDAFAQDEYSKNWIAAEDQSPGSRWPPNILLTHSAACESTGVRTVRSDGHHPASRGSGGLGTSGHAGQEGLAERKSGAETVEAWDCATDCPVAELDRQTGVLTSGANPTRRGSDKFRDAYGEFAGQREAVARRGADSGGASRFFPVFRYQAKANSSERPRLDDGTAHETVKSVGLMRWLVRLVTPPGGLVLDLFAGSGSTAEACLIEGFHCLLIERESTSCELIRKRLSKPIQPVMFGGAA